MILLVFPSWSKDRCSTSMFQKLKKDEVQMTPPISCLNYLGFDPYNSSKMVLVKVIYNLFLTKFSSHASVRILYDLSTYLTMSNSLFLETFSYPSSVTLIVP